MLMTCTHPDSPLFNRPVTTPDWCAHYEQATQPPLAAVGAPYDGSDDEGFEPAVVE